MSLAMVGGIGGFIVALVTIFKKTWAPVTAPIYALLEGLVLGGISAMFELRFPGIAIQAVSLTFGTLAVLLLVYRSGADSGYRELQVGSSGCDGRHCALLSCDNCSGIFRRTLHDDQWFRTDWNRLQHFRGDHRGAESGARF